MVPIKTIQARIRQLGLRPSFWVRPEIQELSKILVPGEEIMQLVSGWYGGGFALLCCTDRRVLLVDKKLFFLTVEDIRYEMIAEVMYQAWVVDSAITLTGLKTIQFKSWNQGRLRQLSSYIQRRTMEARLYGQRSEPVYADLEASAAPVPQPSPSLPIPPQPQEVSGFDLPVQVNVAPPKNPYQIKPYFHRRRRFSRFVTSSQLE